MRLLNYPVLAGKLTRLVKVVLITLPKKVSIRGLISSHFCEERLRSLRLDYEDCKKEVKLIFFLVFSSPLLPTDFFPPVEIIYKNFQTTIQTKITWYNPDYMPKVSRAIIIPQIRRGFDTKDNHFNYRENSHLLSSANNEIFAQRPARVIFQEI